MIYWILNFEFNSTLGILLYWVPASLCVTGYTARTWTNYQKDVAEREKIERWYVPTDTVGSLIGRAVVTVLPVANIWAASFDVAPVLFGDFFRAIGKLFDMPLVPQKKEQHK